MTGNLNLSTGDIFLKCKTADGFYSKVTGVVVFNKPVDTSKAGLIKFSGQGVTGMIDLERPWDAKEKIQASMMINVNYTLKN